MTPNMLPYLQQQAQRQQDPNYESTGDKISGWFNRRNAPQMPSQNPYQGNWGALIGQLEAQSMGNGPSLAGDAYKQAQQTGMNNVMAMSRGGSAGAARMGMQTMGRMNQGLTQGYSNARLQEQLAARSMLTQALSGAGNAWFQPQAANLQAQMGSPTNGQQLMSFLSQLTSGFAQVAGTKSGQQGG